MYCMYANLLFPRSVVFCEDRSYSLIMRPGGQAAIALARSRQGFDFAALASFVIRHEV